MYNMLSDIFVITSVINTGYRPWSYTSQRSCYTKDERFNQTLETIQSIRKLNDNSKILLVECSDIDDKMTHILQNSVDYFIQTYNIDEVRNACLESNKKGFGEIKKLQIACDYISKNNIQFNRLFKISGRYFLNSFFDKNRYVFDKFTFKMYYHDCGSTVLYSVPFSLFQLYIEKLNSTSKFYEENGPYGIEQLIPTSCYPRHDISTLGVSGYVAVTNDKGISEFYTA